MERQARVDLFKTLVLSAPIGHPTGFRRQVCGALEVTLVSGSATDSFGTCNSATPAPVTPRGQ